MNYNIGYVDEDPDQVSKYKRNLREDGFNIIGYDIERGMSVDELINQIYLSNIDLLMIDYKLTEKGTLTFNGDEVERLFNDIKPNFPHIIFTSDEEKAFSHVDNPNIIYEKNMLHENKGHFVEVLKKNIQVYRSYIKKRKEKIEQLIVKEESESLTPEEEDKLLTTQLELSSLDTRVKNEIPLVLFSNESLKGLSETKNEAQSFLQSLIDDRKL